MNNENTTTDAPTSTTISTEAPRLDEISSSIDSTIAEIEDLLPKDPVAQATNTVVGTPEHIAKNELIDKVKETNSTKNVNRVLSVLTGIGYVGLIISALVKFTGIVYDIDYHVPFLKTVISEFGVASLGVFITLIILVMTHITSNGLVNRKWRAIPRVILIWLAIMGLLASMYFDYRAIGNYTKTVVEKQKILKNNNTNDKDGIKISAVDKVIQGYQKSIDGYNKELDSLRDRIGAISITRNKIDENLNDIKEKKMSRLSKKDIRRLNQNVRTGRKQLEELQKEEDRNLARQKDIEASIESIQAKVEAKTKEKGVMIGNVDAQMNDEQFQRLIFLFAIVIFIEITSFGGLLSDFLGNKNLENSIHEQLDTLNNNTNAMSVLSAHISRMGVDQARSFNQQLLVQGNISKMQNLSHVAGLNQQAENIKGFTQATHMIGEATNGIVQEAVTGYAHGIKANLYEQKAKALLDIVQKQSEQKSLDA